MKLDGIRIAEVVSHHVREAVYGVGGGGSLPATPGDIPQPITVHVGEGGVGPAPQSNKGPPDTVVYEAYRTGGGYVRVFDADGNEASRKAFCK